MTSRTPSSSPKGWSHRVRSTPDDHQNYTRALTQIEGAVQVLRDAADTVADLDGDEVNRYRRARTGSS
ncbi:hypothetical protein [Rhodococcus sp. IEGM 1305]|jgi:hypothetical protein|uniref:hypothetical protein n=1 Tax=Rhodococcus sp. IEGM 1305 TaxID=3047092 RepID=UPI0024B64410|nr:hypothetical protein [Rhodococcus sp. IEGM 1305]MDI9949266.1 hypothetical protein [Rhodococcus sp. IEGM 1305]